MQIPIMQTLMQTLRIMESLILQSTTYLDSYWAAFSLRRLILYSLSLIQNPIIQFPIMLTQVVQTPNI